MTKDEAVRLAVDAVDATKQTHYVLRRGDSYDASLGQRHGWKTAEMIGPGNIQNYRTAKPMAQETIVREGIERIRLEMRKFVFGDEETAQLWESATDAERAEVVAMLRNAKRSEAGI